MDIVKCFIPTEYVATRREISSNTTTVQETLLKLTHCEKKYRTEKSHLMLQLATQCKHQYSDEQFECHGKLQFAKYQYHMGVVNTSFVEPSQIAYIETDVLTEKPLVCKLCGLDNQQIASILHVQDWAEHCDAVQGIFSIH